MATKEVASSDETVHRIQRSEETEPSRNGLLGLRRHDCHKMEHNPRNLGVLGNLPRELRDQIYKHLFNQTHCVRLQRDITSERFMPARLRSPYYNALDWDTSVFDTPEHPNLGPPAPVNSTDTKAPWASFPPARDSRVESNLPPVHLRARWTLAEWSDMLAILRTSKQLYEEASPILYEKAMLLFFFDAPLNMKLKLPKLVQTQHIHLHVDLRTAQLRHHETYDQALTFQAAATALCKISRGQNPRKYCLITIEFCETVHFLTYGYFPMALAGLTKFETLVLQFSPVYKQTYYRYLYNNTTYSGLAKWFHASNIQYLREFGRGLRDRLGPCEAVDCKDCYRLTFNPAAHLKANPSLDQGPGPLQAAILASL